MAPNLLHVGLGSLGRRIQADLRARGIARVAAVVDPDPRLCGRPLAEVVEGADPDLRVLGSLDEVPDWSALDVALVTTRSDLADCAETLRALAGRGLAVVSTCEELLWPWLRHAELARELDELARASGARLLGTGVNPGFLMDALPAFVTAVCRSVRSVRVSRVQDAAHRRVPFQQKIGAGLELDAFRARVDAGSLRHVGLGESLHFIGHALGFDLDDWHETIEPVLAERDLACALGPIPSGRAAGVRQVAVGLAGGTERVRLEFVAAIGQAEPRDHVAIDGDPPLDLTLAGGVDGDKATAAIVLNVVRPLLAVPPGLHTMASIPLAPCAAG